MSSRFLFLIGSARRDGNTERLARLAARSLPETAEVRWLRLDEHPLPPFVDHRHDGLGYAAPTGHEQTLLEATLAATDLVFVAPTYWYGLPAATKLYLDHWSAWMRVPGLEFKAQLAGRRLWVVTVNSDDPGVDDSSQPLIRTLELSADYMGMTVGGVLVGHANRPGEVESDHAAVAAAARLFTA